MSALNHGVEMSSQIEAKGQDMTDLSGEEAIIWGQRFGKSAAC
jgi:hypothetical protein